ncbi:unnamed protein product, partial [Rotaria sordida]
NNNSPQFEIQSYENTRLSEATGKLKMIMDKFIDAVNIDEMGKEGQTLEKRLDDQGKINDKVNLQIQFGKESYGNVIFPNGFFN